MNHIMVDLETFATTADATILSIGAVRFDLEGTIIGDEAFYRSVSIDQNRRVSNDTVAWWMKQARSAQSVFHEKKVSLAEALMEFHTWVIGTGGYDNYMWSNGADFDLPMLAHALTQNQLSIPWKHWNSRCMRTYKNLPGAKAVAVPEKIGVDHNALADAYNQAQHLQAIHRELFLLN